VNVCSIPFALYAIEKFGRRPLLIWGGVGMCNWEFIVAIVGSTTASNVSYIVLIVFVCIYIFFSAATWGPTDWAVSG
jgi:SP family sugar:H+ symporter-like MFS transporter